MTYLIVHIICSIITATLMSIRWIKDFDLEIADAFVIFFCSLLSGPFGLCVLIFYLIAEKIRQRNWTKLVLLKQRKS